MDKSQFKPKPGQVDYTNIRWAPVVNSVVKFHNKILIVQRSNKINFYPGYWNGISGFLDDDRNLEEKVREELRGELGLPDDKIISIKQVGLFEQDEPAYKKTWIVHPVLVKVNSNKIKLDWENQNHKWISMNEASAYKLLPGFDQVLAAVVQHFKNYNL